jgi:hypothetical protein
LSHLKRRELTEKSKEEVYILKGQLAEKERERERSRASYEGFIAV